MEPQPPERNVDLFVHETRARQMITAGAAATTTVRLFRGRPVHVLSVAASDAFAPGSAEPLASGSLGAAIAGVLRFLDEHPDAQLLVAGHGADEPLSVRRAASALALLTKRAGRSVNQVARPSVGCGASWPIDRVRMQGYSGAAAERVDLLAFAPRDVPEQKCHPDGDGDGPCNAKVCDLYRKGKYRVDRIGAPAAPPSGARLVVRVVNAKGLALPKVLVQATLPGGEKRSTLTDAQGDAKIDTFPHVEGEVVIDLPDHRPVTA